MCVIAAKPATEIITEDTLERCFDGNSDGAGFVVCKDNQLIASKGFFTFKDFYEAYLPLQQYAAVIHFRIKTHGNRDAAMCHPFEVLPNKLWVAHNGIINISTESDETKSDTWHFVDKVLQPELNKDAAALKRGSFKYLLGCTIGHSKLAFLDNRGTITLINKEKGEYDGKVWYSNGSYKAPRVYSGYNGSSTYYAGGSSTPAKKQDEPVAAGGASGQTTQTTTTATSAYVSLKQVPVSDNWSIDILRDFGFSDGDILLAINDDTAEDMALDLLVAEAAAHEAGDTHLSRGEIAADLLAEAVEEPAETDAVVA